MKAKLTLSKRERDYLRTFKKSGEHSLREFNRANILLFLDKGVSVSEIANLLEVDRTSIWRIKNRYLEQGLEVSLTEDSRSGQP